MSVYMSKISTLFGAFSSDVVFLTALFIFLMVLGMYMGKGSLVAIILSYYPATLLYKLFPYLEKTVILNGDRLIAVNKLAIFLLILIPLTIIVSRYIFSESDYSSSSQMFKVAGLSLALLLLIVLLSYTTVNYDALHNFSPQIDKLFVGNRLFYVNLAPIVLLAFF